MSTSKYGHWETPAVELPRRILHLPPPPAVEAKGFLDIARLDMLQSRLKDLQRQDEGLGNGPDLDSELVRVEIGEEAVKVVELEKKRRALLARPLPKIQAESSSQRGRFIGRAIGEVIDLALLFLLPVTAATKKGGIMAKAGRAIGMTAKTTRTLGYGAKKVADIAISLKQGAQGGSHAQKLPSRILDKVGKLEMLTVGYWGERLGASLDGAPVISSYTDPKALRERDANLKAIDDELRTHRLRLSDSEHRARDSKADPKAIGLEIEEVKAQIEAITAQAESQKSIDETSDLEKFQSILHFEQKCCEQEWEHIFFKQCQSMWRLLEQMLRNWWDEYLPTILQDEEDKLNLLLAKLKELPEQRQQQKEVFQLQLSNLELALLMLSKG